MASLKPLLLTRCEYCGVKVEYTNESTKPRTCIRHRWMSRGGIHNLDVYREARAMPRGAYVVVTSDECPELNSRLMCRTILVSNAVAGYLPNGMIVLHRKSRTVYVVRGKEMSAQRFERLDGNLPEVVRQRVHLLGTRKRDRKRERSNA